jgi:hypothetical protein
MKKIFLNESERLKLISEKEKEITESFAKTFNKIKRIDENEIPTQPNVLFPDWLIKKLNDVHTKVGQGSIFAMDVNKVVEIAKQVVAKEKNIEQIANSTGTISTNVNNVGYDLVLPIENVKKLANAQIITTNKVEGPTTMEVPAVKTTAPLQSFKTNQLTIIVRPMKNDAGEVVPNGYIILSVFPGNPNIPRISEWNGKYAVIIPNQKSSMNEEIQIGKDYDEDLEDNVDLFNKIKEDLNSIDWVNYGAVDLDSYELFNRESDEDLKNSVKWGEITNETVIESIKSFLEERYDNAGVEVDAHGYANSDSIEVYIRKGEDYIKFKIQDDLTN